MVEYECRYICTTTIFGYTADKLTSFGGAAIAYNAIGCPTTYDGKTATWTKGRLSQLSSGTMATGIHNYAYTYNGFGQRVARIHTRLPGTSGSNPLLTGEPTKSSKAYFYDHAGRLIAEEGSKTFHNEGTTTEKIVYLYDESSIIGMAHTVGNTTSTYYFQRNLQGDVIGIYNTSGTLVAKYLYDAWGNCTIASETTNTTVANANPIRYRGYYYDSDTGLYYCNARYYSPKWRRFISPDDTAYLNPESPNGLNLYCYCNNDPVNYADPGGHMPKWLAWALSGAAIVGGIILCATGVGGILGGVLIGAGAGSLINGYVNEANGGSFWGGYIGGAISGALCGVGAGLAGNLFMSLANVANFSFITFGKAVAYAYGFGFGGNMLGTMSTSWWDSGFKSLNLDWRETFTMSALAGTLNVLAGIGSGMASTVAEVGKSAVALDMKLAARVLAGTIAGVTEALYDTTTYILGKIIELL